MPPTRELDFLLALRERAHRDRHRLVLGAGHRFLLKAQERGVPITAIATCRKLHVGSDTHRRVAAAARAGARIVRLGRAAFLAAFAADHARHQGVVVAARQRWSSLADARADEGLCWLALSKVRAPGNLGTIMRSAAAAGAAGLILIGDGVDPFHPAAVRASMGALHQLKLIRSTRARLGAWARRQRARLIATCPTAAARYDQVDLSARAVLMFGDERKGLSERELALCDARVAIPMRGGVDSLNIGISVGVLLFEALRQRGFGP